MIGFWITLSLWNTSKILRRPYRVSKILKTFQSQWFLWYCKVVFQYWGCYKDFKIIVSREIIIPCNQIDKSWLLEVRTTSYCKGNWLHLLKSRYNPSRKIQEDLHSVLGGFCDIICETAQWSSKTLKHLRKYFCYIESRNLLIIPVTKILQIKWMCLIFDYVVGNTWWWFGWWWWWWNRNGGGWWW